MKAGEIYTAPSGKKYVAIDDIEEMTKNSTQCDNCDCQHVEDDCLCAQCWNGIHFKLQEEQK